MTLTLRDTTEDGATKKGDELTYAELDANFVHLKNSANLTFAPSGSGAQSESTEDALRRLVFAEQFGTFAQAVTAAANKTLIVNASTAVAANVTVPATVALRFERSGKLVPATGVTVTINGPVHAGLHQIFDETDGTIAGPFDVETVYPQWWGATADGSTDDATAVQAALTYITNNGGTVWFAPGTYLVATGLTLTRATDGSIFGRVQGAAGTLIKANTGIDILTISCSHVSAGNTRRVIVDGMGFSANHSSARSLVLTNAGYNQFSNLDFLGSGTAIICGSAVNDRNIGNQFSNIRITQPGTGVLISGKYNLFTNLQINEGLQSGAYAIEIQGSYCVVDGFSARGVSGSGGTATVNITGTATGSMVCNGVIFDSYAIGLQAAGARHIKVIGVLIESSQTHGLRLSGTLQGRFDVTIANSSAASAGVSDQINCANTPTDNLVTAQFVGTGPSLDINEASGTNNVFICGTMPNGKTISGTGSVVVSASDLQTKGKITSADATDGIGYATGAGGAVTQGTDRTTGVELNKVTGAITLVSAAGTASWQSFTVTNSAVAATDTVRVVQKSGTDKYMIHVTAVAAGSFEITYATTGGTTTEQPVFNFTVMKGVAA